MLGIGGFGVDYPADQTNPILGPRPQGFGQVASNFQFMKISPAVAYEVSDKFYLGAALNLDWASLSVDPIPIASPAVDPGTGTAYYSRGTATDGAFGLGFQAGLIYRANDRLRLGASYTSPGPRAFPIQPSCRCRATTSPAPGPSSCASTSP